jgi:hypothetical protein
MSPRGSSDRLPPGSFPAPAAPLWSRDLVSRLLVANGVGCAVILAGAYEASLDTTTRNAISWLMVSLLGLAIAGVANAMWLLRCRGSLAVTTRALVDARRRLGLPGATAAGSANGDDWVTVPGLRRYHRPDCPLVAGRRVSRVDSATVARSDLAACEVCEP